MSKDPNTKAPPKGGTPESLEDLVYRPSLSAGRKEVQKASPLVTIPATLLMYGAAILGAYYMAKHSESLQKVVVKTTGIDLTEEEEKEDEPPPPPPPPPAPAAPVAPPRAVERVDAPPPPPINPQQDVVPEIAPRELPKEDLSLAYAGSATGTGSGPAVVGGGGGSGTGSGMSVTGSSSGLIQDVEFSSVKVKYQPPAPPYPPIARIARIQGTVVVQITIGVDGLPVSAKALEGPIQLRPAAEAYAMQWRFEPCLMGGVPQQARFTLNMPFKLR